MLRIAGRPRHCCMPATLDPSATGLGIHRAKPKSSTYSLNTTQTRNTLIVVEPRRFIGRCAHVALWRCGIFSKVERGPTLDSARVVRRRFTSPFNQQVPVVQQAL